MKDKRRRDKGIPFFEAARVTLGEIEAAGVDCVVACAISETVEEVTTPVSWGLVTSNTVSRFKGEMAK